MVIKKNVFDARCRRCSRLVAFLTQSRENYPAYYAAPVAAFGDETPALLIVGLAPGMHGANATGRPFTGDQSGAMLFETLYKYGFSSAPSSLASDDGLQLFNCRITNAVKCLPPQNKPTTAEIKNCSTYLAAELQALKQGSVVIALGSIAHAAVLRAFEMKLTACKFGHGEEHKLPGALTMIDSYHCSRYNTQTRRLTESMFHAVFLRAKELIT
ncbi:MAG: uracil-DNA glycosylase [Thiotrichaceae bacterium]|nr:uracil-DNA glycosylase [Thiotrichaceae bacterium]PCI15063.1 MAG: SPO1 DNA polymerase [Thiotrichales bacterium]